MLALFLVFQRCLFPGALSLPLSDDGRHGGTSSGVEAVWRVAVSVLDVEICAVFEQQFHEFWVSSLDGEPQGNLAIAILGVDVGAVFDKELCDGMVTMRGRTGVVESSVANEVGNVHRSTSSKKVAHDLVMLFPDAIWGDAGTADGQRYVTQLERGLGGRDIWNSTARKSLSAGQDGYQERGETPDLLHGLERAYQTRQHERRELVGLLHGPH